MGTEWGYQWRWGEESDYTIATDTDCHCDHHQNDSCIKMGSDESHFNVINCE